MPKPLTQQQFIDQARAVHGDKYDYSKAHYYNFSTPVEVICPLHGSFFVRPHLHTSNKTTCPKCNNKAKTKTTEQFIAECKHVHGAKYDYSQTVYVGTKQNVTILCPTHGPFQKIANAHLKGFGCPTCAKRNNGNYKWSSFQTDHPDILLQDAQMYLMQFHHIASNYTFYKVGVTRHTATKRFRGYTRYRKQILCTKNAPLSTCLQFEQQVHELYGHLLTKFNEFEPTFYGKTECYDFTNDAVDHIKLTFF